MILERSDLEGANGIRSALMILENIRNSSFIPFASPSPSQSEKVLAENVDCSIVHLREALRRAKDLGYTI